MRHTVSYYFSFEGMGFSHLILTVISQGGILISLILQIGKLERRIRPKEKSRLPKIHR